VFFINVPVGAFVLAATPRVVPESRSATASKRGYDAGGAITITLGLIALVFTLIKTASWGWGSGKTIAGFAIAAILIAAFITIEKRHPDPLVPLRIFSNRSLASSDVTMLLVAAGLFGMFYFCTLYLQQVLGYSALKTGLSYLPFSLTLVAASTGASRLVDRFSPKPVLVTGLLISTVGFILMTQVTGQSDYRSHVLPAFLILALGLGLSFVPITISATNGVAPEDSGLASGLLNTTQQVGGSLGLAILSTISTSRLNHALHGGAALPAALTHAFKGAFTAGAILCAAAAVLALVLLPRRKRAADNEEVEVVALSFARCPGAPYCGALSRIAGWGRRIRPRAPKPTGPTGGGQSQANGDLA
jgi:Na+/melibiose symporter-like transporter